MVPLPDSVAIPFVAQYIDEEKHFNATEQMERSATTMLDELHRWAITLETLRQPKES